jgi:hypothetical protein
MKSARPLDKAKGLEQPLPDEAVWIAMRGADKAGKAAT